MQHGSGTMNSCAVSMERAELSENGVIHCASGSHASEATQGGENPAITYGFGPVAAAAKSAAVKGAGNPAPQKPLGSARNPIRGSVRPIAALPVRIVTVAAGAAMMNVVRDSRARSTNSTALRRTGVQRRGIMYGLFLQRFLRRWG